MTPADAATLPAPTDPALATRLALMREIADRAEPICLEHYQSPSLRVERKPDGSVVTPADKDTERMARDLIHQHFPQDHITGEEFPQHEGSSDYRWIIDPIDGTDSYTRGIHTFANLIAVKLPSTRRTTHRRNRTRLHMDRAPPPTSTSPCLQPITHRKRTHRDHTTKDLRQKVTQTPLR